MGPPSFPERWRGVKKRRAEKRSAFRHQPSPADVLPLHRRAGSSPEGEWAEKAALSCLSGAFASAVSVSPPLAGPLWFAAATHPPGRIQSAGQAPTKRRMRPIRRVLRQTVLDRVEMRAVHVSREVPLVTDRVLPVPPLPDAPLAASDHDGRSPFTGGQRFRERDLDRAPTTGEVGIAFRQGPQAVHVVGKEDPGVDAESALARTCRTASRNASFCITNRCERRSSRFTVKKNVPPGTRLRR
jgi:hypothetical protein